MNSGKEESRESRTVSIGTVGLLYKIISGVYEPKTKMGFKRVASMLFLNTILWL